MNNHRSFYRHRAAKPLWRLFGEAVLAAIIFGLLSAAALTFSGSEIRSLPGQVRVIDGDSLWIGSEKIRLWGIDAPEIKQDCRSKDRVYPCGLDAQKHLRQLVVNASLSCNGLGKDRYDRLLAVCRDGKKDINAALVRDGFAYAYGGYSAEENDARNARRGIWAAENERPKSYRERNKAAIDLAPGLLDALYQWVMRLTA